MQRCVSYFVKCYVSLNSTVWKWYGSICPIVISSRWPRGAAERRGLWRALPAAAAAPKIYLWFQGRSGALLGGQGWWARRGGLLELCLSGWSNLVWNHSRFQPGDPGDCQEMVCEVGGRGGPHQGNETNSEVQVLKLRRSVRKFQSCRRTRGRTMRLRQLRM